MKKFDDVLNQIALTEGVQPDEVFKDMQQAIQEAYHQRDESNQHIWDLIAPSGVCPTPEEFILRVAMMIDTDNSPLQ